MKRTSLAVHATLLCLLLATMGGCGNSTQRQLLGTWQGRAETTSPADDLPNSEAPELAQLNRTVLEAFDFAITLDFVDAESVQMALAGSPETRPLAGTWKIVEQRGPECVLVIETSTDASRTHQAKNRTPNSATTSGTTPEKNESVGERKDVRRFRLQFLEEGQRFRLSDPNAPPNQGAILFTRAKTN